MFDIYIVKQMTQINIHILVKVYTISFRNLS